jgi:hypothetical protein
MVTGRLRFWAKGEIFGEKQRFFTDSAGCRWDMKRELKSENSSLNPGEGAPATKAVAHGIAAVVS